MSAELIEKIIKLAEYLKAHPDEAGDARLIEAITKLAEYIKAHPDEARAGLAKLSPDAQKPVGDIIKIFVSDKDRKTKHEEIQALTASLPANIAAEIEEYRQELAKKLAARA